MSKNRTHLAILRARLAGAHARYVLLLRIEADVPAVTVAAGVLEQALVELAAFEREIASSADGLPTVEQIEAVVLDAIREHATLANNVRPVSEAIHAMLKDWRPDAAPSKPVPTVDQFLDAMWAAPRLHDSRSPTVGQCAEAAHKLVSQ